MLAFWRDLIAALAAAAATLVFLLEGLSPTLLGLHGAAVLFSALCLRRWLALRDCRQRGLLEITVLMAALVPGFSLLALPVALLYGAHDPPVEEEDHTLIVEVPRLPAKPLEFDRNLAFSRGGLFEVLERSSDVDKQITAVMATTRMKAKQAIPILKVAMRDETDDVRLLAYSIKDRKESEISGRIKHLIGMLDEDDRTERRILSSRERAAAERSLAFLYWELVYLDLADGDIRAYFLAQVVTRARAALEVLRYGPLAVLLARALMEQGDYPAAGQALEAAEHSGMDRLALAPYRAEIAFHEHRFSEVRRRLMEVGSSPHEAMREVIDYWRRPP